MIINSIIAHGSANETGALVLVLAIVAVVAVVILALVLAPLFSTMRRLLGGKRAAAPAPIKPSGRT